MTRFTPTQLDDLNTRSRHLVAQMRQLVDKPTAPALGVIMQGLRAAGVTYGRPGVAHLIRGWLDQLIDATPGARVGSPDLVMFTNSTYTGPAAPEDLTPELTWVAEALSARVAGNQVRLYELIDAIPAGPKSGMYLLRALEMVVRALVSYETPGDQPFRPGIYHLTAAGPVPM